MKPPAFEYARASTVEEAVAMLADGETKLLAGGQSVVPMLNFRMLSVERLVDITHIPGLDTIEATDTGLRIGALTRHHALETSDLVRERFPMLSAAMKHVAHLAIRNRGTIGGSLAHADPAAELPMMAVLLDATLHVVGPGGERAFAAQDFFTGTLTTALAEDEMLVAIELPGLPKGGGWGFEECAQRWGDFALAGAAATIAVSDGIASDVRIALMGVDETPVRARDAETLLAGRALNDEVLDTLAVAARAGVTPNSDLHASDGYRRHLTGVLTKRVVTAAWRRATGTTS